MTSPAQDPCPSLLAVLELLIRADASFSDG